MSLGDSKINLHWFQFALTHMSFIGTQAKLLLSDDQLALKQNLLVIAKENYFSGHIIFHSHTCKKLVCISSAQKCDVNK